MEMKDRIARIIKKEQLTSQQFAEIVDIQSSTISHILAGRNLPSCKILTNILEKFPNISADWLLLGNGDMLRQSQKTFISEPEPVTIRGEEQFTKVNQNELFLPNKEDAQADEELLSNGVSEPISEPQNVNNDVIKSNAIPEKLIVMYSDKTFEIFLTK